MPRRKSLLILVTAIAAIQTVSAQDWTQWRGPNRDGVVKDFVVPAIWPEKLKLVWKTEVGSGYSSPVASKDRAWIHAQGRGRGHLLPRPEDRQARLEQELSGR